MIKFLATTMVLLGLAGGAVEAQTPQGVRAGLDAAARKGDKLTVTTAGGAVVKGRLLRIDPDGMVVLTGAGETPIPYSDIDRVRRRRNGIATGAATGVIAGLIVGLLAANAADDEISSAPIVGTALAIGAGAGIGIDALVSRNRTIYRRRPATSALAIQPRSGGAAVRWSAAW